MHRVDELKKLFYRNRLVVERGEFEGMWSTVTPCDADSPAPSARSKHSATLLCGHVYLFGGRNGNVPLKDFWKYNLAEGTWQQLQPSGDRPPCLQEHTAISYRDSIYVFGGEVGFSAGTETPLWMYDVKQNCWRKVRARKGVQVPRGRRGHTALVHRGTMLIYGGYQDLRGSCSELWAFHFETESWHLISSTIPNGRSTGSGDTVPPARHKHSAIMHEDSMWVYGGMTDLQERADLWRWDTVSKTWTGYKLKHTPGPLHSHAACRLPSSMVLFGGERDGHSTNDLWKFHFDTGAWEKLIVNGLRPQARAECVAFAVSELLLKDTSGTSLESRMARTRSRTMHSNNTNNTATTKPSSYIPHNRVSPYEKTYVFKPSQGNYTDGSDLSRDPYDSAADNARVQSGGFLREITKLSQLNLSRLSHNKCSYTVLATGNNDSTESLLRQHSSGVQDTDSESSTPNRMIKSRSAYAIKKKYNEKEPTTCSGVQETCIDSTTLRNTRINSMTRDPISVPNFGALARQAPALTPVEAARLVFLDTDDDDDDDDDDEHCRNNIDTKVIHVQSYTSPKKCHVYENFKSVKRGESYNSHLGYADNPLYAVNFGKCTTGLEQVSDETSDYASIETMNRLSSSSSYSSRQQTPQDRELDTNTTGGGGATLFRAKGTNKVQVADGPFGFCNPNYMGPDIQLLLSSDNKKQQYAKLLNTPDSVLEDALGRSTSRHMFPEENLELQNMVNNSEMNNKPHHHRHGRHKSATVVPPKSLELVDMAVSSKATKRNQVGGGGKCRASSASRVERHTSNCGTTVARHAQVTAGTSIDVPTSDAQPDVFVPLYVFIVGGKEQGQVTVFKRPISIWKLKLF